MGIQSKTILILNHGTGWKWLVTSTLHLLCPRKNVPMGCRESNPGHPACELGDTLVERSRFFRKKVRYRMMLGLHTYIHTLHIYTYITYMLVHKLHTHITYIHTYTHTLHAYMYIHTHIHTLRYIHYIHTYIHYIYTHTYITLHSYTYTHYIHTCTKNTYIHTYMYINTYTQTYIHTHTHSY
jgi:hypothetical protein